MEWEFEASLQAIMASALALDAFSRLWFATFVSLTGFSALAAVLTARCAGIVALWEELGGGAASR